jgi:hypothetical protein
MKDFEKLKTSNSNEKGLEWITFLVVTYVQFDSNIRVLFVFLGFLKNT